ncbi:CHAT domain-containing protein [Erythrobacter insulae]|uniref:CHAT domain-containing protein n=1 Tax=Erythrobacter insulae TaxID=2584124 RepID=A0A547PDL7_9SPHN|nr:CHAT domain-containing protein [Erythrobacter insulae]TRD12230.1 CHAT domain-containing protein [Erythrobacter insulae]
MRRIAFGIITTLGASAIVGAALSAQTSSVLTRDSFPIGDGSGILCQVQDRSVENPAKGSIFDRRWAVVCRDNPQPIAEVFAFKNYTPAAAAKLGDMRRFPVTCPDALTGDVAGIAGSRKSTCAVDDTGLGWSSITVNAAGMTYVAEGFSAFDDATILALKSVLDNRIAQGTIDAASTSVSDPLSFARVQAESLKPEQALAEGYRRNLGGEYAEAAAYFETLQQRLEDSGESDINPGEFFVNRALQKSNLGEFSVATRLFEQASDLTADDPIAGRLQRNFEAIHLLNQGLVSQAVDRLGQQVEGRALGAAEENGKLAITLPLSESINQSQAGSSLLGIVDELKLTDPERAQIIDAQALQIRGTALRINGDYEGATRDLVAAFRQAVEVRDGRVTSITRLRSQVLADLALIAEREGREGDAETYLRNSLSLVEAQYPERRAVSAVEARLAAFLLRQSRDDEAMDLYRKVIDRAVGKRNAVTGFANQLNPYYRALAPRVSNDPDAAEAFFKAAQVLVRPGVAETQAILARELSANSDEAARLFRQSIDLGRDIERLRMRFQTLIKGAQSELVQQQLNELSVQIENLERAQLNTQVQLNDYPQYRVVAPPSLELADFRAALKPGEAYARLAMVGGDIFMFYADRGTAKAYQVDLSIEDMEYQVDLIRASISSFEGGQYVTYPFEVREARNLYKSLFAPIAGDLANVDHLIFEPDGALLRLPVDILVSDDVSVELYETRSDDPDADPFDFTGVNWMAKNMNVSTAVSAQAFVDSRKVERSNAARQYLGMGQNVPVGDALPRQAASQRGSSGLPDGLDCGWGSALWNSPIDDTELVIASNLIGQSQSQLITGASFTDDQIIAKEDLDEFRVLHFATHGLVTPPNPNCPAKPALLTSFGSGDSDGLLSFEEIFDLNLNADIVILSACDTAGEASIEATRAAGIASGGGTALDGLVRAFIGAGGRAVLASHWPAPDDYDATERLMAEMFRRGKTENIGDALRQSQTILMNEADTSHPYYWAGFAVIGDAARPLLSDDASFAESGAAPFQPVIGQ